MNFVTFISFVSYLLLFTVFCLSPVVHAQQGTFYFANESINYNAIENSFLQWRIQKGAEVYTGRSYDISGAIGTSGFIAHWSDWKVEDTDCFPDTIIPVRYQESNGAIDPKNFYINPVAFPEGNYFTWDGCREWKVLVKNPDGSFTTETKAGQLPNENRFAFTVKRHEDIIIPVREPSALPVYTPPAFIITKPVPIETPTVAALPEIPTEQAPWWIQWWWLELIVVGVIAFVFINDEFDIL